MEVEFMIDTGYQVTFLAFFGVRTNVYGGPAGEV